MAYQVSLTLLDYLDAVEVGVARMRQSAQRGHNAANVRQRDWFTRLRNEVCGAAAELATARWLGIEWSRSVGTYRSEADVGQDCDVRHCERHDGRLILRRHDHPYRQFVLVTGSPPNLLLQGYCRAAEMMVPEFWRNPGGFGGAWFVPSSRLLPIEPSGLVPPCLRQTATARA